METFPREVYEFPVRIPLKVIGRNQDSFEEFVIGLFRMQLEEDEFHGTSTRSSREDAYLSVTVMFTARSREHLDSIYRELQQHERILMVI